MLPINNSVKLKDESEITIKSNEIGKFESAPNVNWIVKYGSTNPIIGSVT